MVSIKLLEKPGGEIVMESFSKLCQSICKKLKQRNNLQNRQNWHNKLKYLPSKTTLHNFRTSIEWRRNAEWNFNYSHYKHYTKTYMSDLRPNCFCGIIICTEWESLVFGIVWLIMAMALATLPTFLTCFKIYNITEVGKNYVYISFFRLHNLKKRGIIDLG